MKKLLFTLSTLLLAALLFLASPWGLLTIAKASEHLLANQLHIEGLSGSLSGPIQFKSLRYHSQSLDVDLNTVQLNASLWQLLFDKIVIQNLSAKHIIVKNEKQRWKVANVIGHVTYNAKQLDGSLSADLQQPYPLHINLTSTQQGQLTLVKLNVNNKKLAWKVQGEVDLKKKQVTTHSNAELNIPMLGINVQALNSKINYSKRRIALQINALSSKKWLHLRGQLNQRANSWLPNLTLSANDFTFINLPTYHIIASPELKLGGQLEKLRLSGTIHISSAKINLPDFSDTVTLPTQDLHIIGKKDKPTLPLLEQFNQVNIDLSLGKNVSIKTLGINGLLNGQLKITKQPKQALYADGELYLEKGKYQRYGYSLDINKGKLIYHHTDLANPELLLIATRHIATTSSASSLAPSNFSVGIRVTGSIDQPETTLFSSPITLSDKDIMSYLLFGRPADANSELSVLLQAAKSLRLSDDNNLSKSANNLRKNLGITEFGVESGPDIDTLGNVTGESNNFVIGKKVSDKIYLRYVTGMQDDSSSLLIKYLLSKNWTLQVNSSPSSSGMDIIYSIDRD